MNFPSLSSKTITALRLPLALMVVFIHSFGKPEECAIDWSELGSTDIFNIVRIFGSHVLSHIAVPTFFLISGYLFFIKAQKTDWAFFKKQWKNRVRTLLIPYIIWNALCVLYFVPFKMGDILLKGKPWSGLYDYLRDNFSLSILWNAYSFWGGQNYCITSSYTTKYQPNTRTAVVYA